MTRTMPILVGLVAACTAGEPTDAAVTDGATADTTGVDSGTTDVIETGTVPPGEDVLVVPHSAGVTFVGLDGTVASFSTWTELVGSCNGCGAEGSSADGDGLLLSFTTAGGGGGNRAGGVARVGLDGALDFRLDGFGFPHDVIRDPFDDSLVVAETSNNQLTWIDGDGGSDAAIRTLTSANADFINTPNGAERLDYNGRTYLIVSHRPAAGRITMWDITDGTPVFQWRFPASGEIETPHCPILREIDGQWWMLWAHTEGVGRNNGSVGIAVSDDPTVAPTYVADLTPDSATGTFTFLRGVELTPDERLFVTDSGAGPTGQGRVLEVPWPELEVPKTGETGEIGDQVFIEMGASTVVLDGIQSPFEGWLWNQVVSP